MTDLVKMIGQSRWKRIRGEAVAPKRKMLRDKSVEVADITVLSDKTLIVFQTKAAAVGGTVILRGQHGGVIGNAYRGRLEDAIKKALEATREAQAPAVTEPVQSPDLAKFMSAFGSLEGKDIFGGDAVEFQREMREEWR